MSKAVKTLIVTTTHLFAVGIGFALGIYFLPILTAPDSPDIQVVQSTAEIAQYSGEFRRDLQDSDAFHWGEGTIHVGRDSIVFDGELSPGPDYRLYLSPSFVETESDFEALKSQMIEVGPVRTFENFQVDVPASVDPSRYSAAIVWCESFGEFITAATYQ